MATPGEVMGGAASSSKNIAATVTGVVIVGTTGVRFFRNVPDEHVGVIKHFGRGKYTKHRREISLRGKTLREEHNVGDLYGIVETGSHRIWPIIQSMVLVSLGDNSESLGHFEFDTADKNQMETEAWMTWHVMKGEDYAWRAINRIGKPQELNQRVRSTVIGHLGYVLSGMTRTELRKPGAVQGTMQDLCNPTLEEYGTRLKAIDLRAPVISSAQKHFQGLELQAKAQRLQAEALGRIATQLEQSQLVIPS
jgi:hypothetical protein